MGLGNIKREGGRFCWTVRKPTGEVYDEGCEDDRATAEAMIAHHIEDMTEEGIL